MNRQKNKKKVIAFLLSMLMLISLFQNISYTPVAEGGEAESVASESDAETAEKDKLQLNTYANQEENQIIMQSGEDVRELPNASVRVLTYVNGVETEISDSTVLKNGDRITVFLDWKISNLETNRVTSETDLVYDLKATGVVMSNSSGNILSSNVPVGTYSIDEDGKLHLKITDPALLQKSDINGGVSIDGVIDVNSLQEDENGIVRAKIAGTTIQVQKTDPSGTPSVRKSRSGNIYSVNGKNYQDFTVEIIVNGNATNLAFDDVLGGNLALSGNIKVNNTEVTPTVSGNNVHYDIGTVKKGDKYIITYTTEILDAAFSDDYSWWSSDSKNYNMAKVSDSNGKNADSTTFAMQSKTWIKKSNHVNDDGTITWTVVVNDGDEIDLSGAKVTDVIPSGLEIVGDVTVTDANGVSTTITGNAFTNDGYTFANGAKGKYTFAYKTKETGATSGPQDRKYTNTATIKDDKYHVDKTITDTATIKGDWVTKKVESVDTSTKEITWKTTITVPASEIAGKALSFYDTLGTGLVYKTGSMNVSYGDNTKVQNRWNDTDITVPSNAFTMNLGTVSGPNTITITYKTTYDPGEYKRFDFINKAKINWAGTYSDPVDATYHYENKDLDILQYKYVRNSKGIESTWGIQINPLNHADIVTAINNGSKLIVYDKLQFTSESGSVLGWTPKADIVPNSIKMSGQSTDLITATVDSDGTIQFDLTEYVKNNPNASYVEFEYTVKLSDETVQYMIQNNITRISEENSAIAYLKNTDSTKKEVGKETGNGKTTPELGTLLTKSYTYDSNTAPYAKYKIEINPNGYKLINGSGTLTLEDTLGKNLQIVLSTIALTDADGNVITGIQTNYDTAMRLLKITNIPDKTPCYLSYDVFVDVKYEENTTFESLGSAVDVSNNCKLYHVSKIYDSKNTVITGNIQKSRAWAESATGAVVLTKHHGALVLPDAEFKLTAYKYDDSTHRFVEDTDYSSNRSQGVTIGNVKTSATGTVNVLLFFDRLYKIEEVTPPAGYVSSGGAYYVLLKGADYATISNAVTAFKAENHVEINEMISGSALYIENTPGYSVTVNKRDQNGAVVTGAEFTLYKEGTTPGVYDVLIGTKAVDENGKVSFTENLSIGKYKLTETKVPDGYTGSFERKFEISDTAMTFVFDAVNTKQYGSYTITKKGSDGNLLPGVEFTLYDESNNVVAAKKTDANGIVLFDNLELGKEYTVKETKGVDGYNVDENPWRFTLTSTQSTGTKEVTNQKQKGQIAITKENAADATEKIADVVFELYDENKQVIKNSSSNPLRSTTDTNGIAKFSELSYGTYYVREISAPSDCILDDTLRKVIVDSDTPATITVQNQKRNLVTPYFSFYIEKKDGTGQALAGATFKLYRANGNSETLSETNLIQTAVSGTDGKVYFVNLNNDTADNPDQYYTLLETTAPYGYETVSSKYVFKLSDINVTAGYGHSVKYAVSGYGSIKKLTQYGTNGVITNNKITGQIKLVKNDESGNALSGAVYGAYVHGVQKAVGTSNNAGEIVFNGLTYDTTYVIKENTPPDGYACSNKEFTVKIGDTSSGSGYVDTVNGLYQYQITATDQKLQLSVSKKSITGASEISDAKLALYDSADNQIDVWTSTGSMHTVDSAKLKVHGVYTLKELSAPNGYGYSKDTKFQILLDGSIRLLSGSDENASVSGSVVTMRDREISFKLAKVDIAGNRIGGAGLQIQIRAGGQTLYSWDSSTGYDLVINSANAERIGIRVPDTLGTYNEYIYHEVSAPQGYEKSADIPFYIDYYGNVYLKDAGGNYVPVPDNRIVMTDADSTTDIKVNKVEAVGGAPVRNAKLEIVDAANNTRVISWDTTYSTKVLSGTLFTKGKTYKLREVSAPDGYVYASSITFMINASGQVEIDGQVVPGNLINMIDKRIDLKFDKVSHDTGSQLSNAKIGVYENGTNQLIYQFDTDGTTVDIGKYLKAGYYDSLGNAQEKLYYLKEMTAPFGYTVASDIYFKLAVDGTVSVMNRDGVYQVLQGNVITMEDASVYMKVNKTDAQGTGLPGAKLQIEDIAGRVVTSWVTNGNASNIELWKLSPYTAANPNVYTLRETQAPYGYEKADPIEFYVTDSYDLYVKNGDIFVKDASGILSMIDLQKKIQISKEDAVNSEKLDGAKLQITDASGTEIASWVTSKQEGARQLNVLQFRPDTEYILTEISAPVGYKLADAITFKIGSDNIVYVKGTNGSFTAVGSGEIVMVDQREDTTTSESTETTETSESTETTDTTTEVTTTEITTTEVTTATTTETTTSTSTNTATKTGDATPVAPITVIMLVAAAGIMILGVSRKKRHDK